MGQHTQKILIKMDKIHGPIIICSPKKYFFYRSGSVHFDVPGTRSNPGKNTRRCKYIK